MEDALGGATSVRLDVQVRSRDDSSISMPATLDPFRDSSNKVRAALR